ncbi:MAG: hypothetical protein ACRC63_00860, partial [Metamycoplasmataceae bacterium]
SDLSWLLNLNDFVNPVAGISKISNPIKPFYEKPLDEMISSFGSNPINFSDYKVSQIEGSVTNNLFENKNYFYSTEGLKDYWLTLNLKVETILGEEIEMPVRLAGLERIQQLTRRSIDVKTVSDAFDALLLEDLSDDPNKSRETIVTTTKNLLSIPFNIIVEEIQNSSSIMLLDDNFDKITKFDTEDFKDQLSIFFFYAYGLSKLDGNIEHFDNNRQLFLDSIDPISSTQNIFLGSYFGRWIDEIKRPLFFELSTSIDFLTFTENGLKVSNVGLGIFWSSVILVILAGTVLIYYRKDFT